MTAILAALFPVFGLIALGFALGRWRVLGDAAGDHLGRFVAQVTLPVLTFQSIAGMRPEELAQPVMALVVVGGAWATYGLHFAIERWRGESAPEANAIALGAAYGNSGFVGLPVCLALLGHEALGPAAFVMALNTACVFTLGLLMRVFTAPGRHNAGGGLRAALAPLALNPLVLACLLGMAAALVRLTLPGPVAVLLSSIAAATAPCALVAIGMFVAGPLGASPLGGFAAGLARGLLGKLVVSPLLTLALIVLLPPLPPAWAATALIMAAVPAASSVYIIAAQAGERARHFGAAIVVWSTVLAAFSLPLVLAALSAAGHIAIAGQ